MIENKNNKGFWMTLLQTLKEDENKLDNYSVIATILIVISIAFWVYFVVL